MAASSNSVALLSTVSGGGGVILKAWSGIKTDRVFNGTNNYTITFYTNQSLPVGSFEANIRIVNATTYDATMDCNLNTFSLTFFSTLS